jgi:hypothetical protein
MNQSTDIVLKSTTELIRIVSQSAATAGGRLFPQFLTSETHVAEFEGDDIPFDDRGGFLELKSIHLSCPDAVSLASAQGAGMRDYEPTKSSSGNQVAGVLQTNKVEARRLEDESGVSESRAPAELAERLAQVAAEVESLPLDHLIHRQFSGVSEAACWVQLLANLEEQIGLLSLRAVGAAANRDAVLAQSNENKVQRLRDLVDAETMNSSVQRVREKVNWHGGFFLEGEDQVFPRRLHRRAFALGKSMCKSLWAGTELKNSLEKIRSNLEAVSEARCGLDAARKGYRKLWEGACAFHEAARGAGFGELALEWISGQKFIGLADIEGLLDAVQVDLDWSEKRLNEALLEWEETKAALDQALQELEAGNLRQAELLESKISHRFWLDLDVEAVCRELDAILAKHLSEVHSVAARDGRAAVLLAARHAGRYAHSPRIRKGFLKFKSGLESEMLLRSSSREKITTGFSTLVLYGAVAACAFAAGVFWFDIYLQEKASRSETVEKDWIEKRSREQSLDRAKSKSTEELRSADSSGN